MNNSTKSGYDKLSVACWNIQGIKTIGDDKVEHIKKDIIKHDIYALI